MACTNRRWWRVLFALSLALNAIAIVIGVVVVERKGGLPWLETQISGLLGRGAPGGSGGSASLRASVFDELPIGPDDLVFLGDSNIALGEWGELMDDPRVRNRGISGDDAGMVLGRLDQIVAGGPRGVVIAVGVNDLQRRIPTAQTTDDYNQLVDRILSGSDRTEIWLLPVFAVNTELYRRWILPSHPGIHMPEDTEVAFLNGVLRGIADHHPRVHYLPVPGVLDAGRLGDDFTLDGLHLNGRGMRVVAQALAAAMNGTRSDRPR